MDNGRKNIVLLISFTTSLFLIYHLTIKKTVFHKTMYTELLKEKKMLNSASQKKRFLHQKNQYLDSILKINDISIHNTFQQTLLKKVSDFSSEQKVEIELFQEPHISLENKITVETYSLLVKGSFISLLKLINYLERQNLGKLNSISFEKKNNYKKRKKYLICKLYIKKVKS